MTRLLEAVLGIGPVNDGAPLVAQEVDAMAWEPRPGGTYYYKSVRRGGRVKKLYYGKGPAAELAAQLIADARARRAEEAAVLQAELSRLEPLDAVVAALDAACHLMVEAEMTSAGYTLIDRKWRRRRGRITQTF